MSVTPPLSYRYGAASDVGRVRANNEDAVLVDPGHGLIVLADGMGGYNAGEVASALAVDTLARHLTDWLDHAPADIAPRELRRAMEIGVDSANHVILETAAAHSAYAGMGTTLVMALLRERKALIGHVGDSRAYRWRAGELTQLTRDHSLLQEQIDAGLLSEPDAMAALPRNLVTRALGVEETVLLDVQEVALIEGDRLLLCSDGLTDMVPTAMINELLTTPEPLPALADRLVALANERGGRDNISVALAEAVPARKKIGLTPKLLTK